MGRLKRREKRPHTNKEEEEETRTNIGPSLSKPKETQS